MMNRPRRTKASSPGDQFPHDPQRSNAQIQGLLQWFGSKPARVLDLGCGSGRVLVPLARAGHDVIGIDRDASVLRECRHVLKKHRAKARLVRRDFLRAFPPALAPPGTFDAVLCLGNTVMTITAVSQAADLLSRCARLLKLGAVCVIDDLPYELWPELTEGRWQSGLSPDRQLQLIWAPGDNVFAIRHGRELDPECWDIRPTDTCYRLWSIGELELAAKLAGLSAPVWEKSAGLIVLRRASRIRPRRSTQIR